MEKVAIFDTSYGTFNMGDFIIVECANQEIAPILKNKFVVRSSTHTPQGHFYQFSHKSGTVQFYKQCKYKFLLGTNIIKENMIKRCPDWNVNIFNYQFYKGTILVGAGLDGNFDKAKNLYTKKLYQKILNKDYYHSTRDEKTKKFLTNLGFKAINTGCPTMWFLTPDFCKQIPTQKAENVIFTLTDYRKDIIADRKLIDILQKNYKKLFYWCQGSRDDEYINEIMGEKVKNIEFIEPDLKKYDEFLKSHEVDYVGTRLHGGIYAMRHKKRSIIIAVDNRSVDIKKTYNLPVVLRENIEKELDKKIKSNFKTDINLNMQNISDWKKQFEENK